MTGIHRKDRNGTLQSYRETVSVIYIRYINVLARVTIATQVLIPSASLGDTYKVKQGNALSVEN